MFAAASTELVFRRQSRDYTVLCIDTNLGIKLGSNEERGSPTRISNVHLQGLIVRVVYELSMRHLRPRSPLAAHARHLRDPRFMRRNHCVAAITVEWWNK